MTASTVAQYLAALPADRRAALSAVRKAINENLPDGYEEGMQFGMIGWYVPLSVYPAGYGENPKVPLSFVALASPGGEGAHGQEGRQEVRGEEGETKEVISIPSSLSSFER